MENGYSTYAFHLLRLAELQAFKESKIYAPASLGGEGFIHFSNEIQLFKVARRFYHSFDDLHVIRVVLSAVSDKLAIEPALVHQQFAGANEELFAHLYRELLWSEVDSIARFRHECEFEDLAFEPSASYSLS